jgi:hypothetical protein
VDQAGGVNGAERAAQFLADNGRFTGTHRALRREDCVQRAAADELHPQPDAAVMDVRPVHRDDMRVAHACEGPRFVEDPPRRHRAAVRGLQELQRDLAIEPRIARPVHFAERAFADFFEQEQVPPSRDVVDNRHGGR